MELVSSENVCKSQSNKRSNILSLFPVDWAHKINDLCSNKKTSQNHNQDFHKYPEAVILEKGVLKNFPKFTGKRLCQSIFFNKVVVFSFKKRLWHRCFPENLAKFSF